MSLRTRIAVVITAALVLFGIGAAAQADPVPVKNTPNNGCVVVPPAKLAVCIGRF